MTVLEPTPTRLTRDALSLGTPDSKTIPLAPLMEQRGGKSRRFSNGEGQRIPSTTFRRRQQGVPSSFFPTWGRSVPFDRRDLSDDRACVGRSISKSLAAITYGQHWLNVKFRTASCTCPFGS